MTKLLQLSLIYIFYFKNYRFQTIIERKITYASCVWFPYMQQSHGQRLIFSIQRSCLLPIALVYKHFYVSPLNFDRRYSTGSQNSTGRNFCCSHSKYNIPYVKFQPLHYLPNTSIFTINLTYRNTLKDQVGLPLRIFTVGSKFVHCTGLTFCIYYGIL